MAELSIAADTVFRLLEILHELAGQDQGLEREEIDDEGDDASAEGLVEEPDDERSAEVATLLHDLNVDERSDLLALMLLGRDEFDLTDWEEAKTEAEEQLGDGSLHGVIDLVTGDAAVAEFLEAGLGAFGYRFAEWDAENIVGKPEASGDGGPRDVADAAQRQAPGHISTRALTGRPTRPTEGRPT
jgi:Protein of unknown function (DUF3775)